MPFIKLIEKLPEVPDQPTTADRYINVDRIHEFRPFDDTTTTVELTNGKTFQVMGAVTHIASLLHTIGVPAFNQSPVALTDTNSTTV